MDRARERSSVLRTPLASPAWEQLPPANTKSLARGEHKAGALLRKASPGAGGRTGCPPAATPSSPLLLQQGAEDLKEVFDEALNVVTAGTGHREEDELTPCRQAWLLPHPLMCEPRFRGRKSLTLVLSSAAVAAGLREIPDFVPRESSRGWV